MSKRGIRRPTEEEALGRITRWEDGVKKAGFDVGRLGLDAYSSSSVGERVKETEIVIRNN